MPPGDRRSADDRRCADGLGRRRLGARPARARGRGARSGSPGGRWPTAATASSPTRPGPCPGTGGGPRSRWPLLWALLGWRIGDLAGWAALPAYLLLRVAGRRAGVDRRRRAPAARRAGAAGLPGAAGAAWSSPPRGWATGGPWCARWPAWRRCTPCTSSWRSSRPSSLGFGDVKLSGLIGLLLGWLGVAQAVVGAAGGLPRGRAGRARHAGRPAGRAALAHRVRARRCWSAPSSALARRVPRGGLAGTGP